MSNSSYTPLMSVTGMYPFERAAGNDLLRIREAFPGFQILGGFDKRKFAEGKSCGNTIQRLSNFPGRGVMTPRRLESRRNTGGASAGTVLRS